ncbi:hypothetical protein DL89DRAFT_269230 [Linderina pennispora]|uniref:Uncharacterized protein n=1 Tax=Linderina pennispora TaxID=61395 RepID=A0A1Y1W1L8_9FUNG|nr:uncharacterized protein DL89DRAFT_269230 [Linderina pennispora]ORX67401.1 hypothetical protein DL89DRAFT_269230 [Linderina pennispora]
MLPQHTTTRQRGPSKEWSATLPKASETSNEPGSANRLRRANPWICPFLPGGDNRPPHPLALLGWVLDLPGQR